MLKHQVHPVLVHIPKSMVDRCVSLQDFLTCPAYILCKMQLQCIVQTLTEAVIRLAPPGGLFDTTVVRYLFPVRSEGDRDQGRMKS